jgi:hypothetical protein
MSAPDAPPRLFMVTYTHPDEAGWQRHVMAHVGWLQDQVAAGHVIASGPLPAEADKAALLIMAAQDEAALRALIATDPFALEGLIDTLVIKPWDPIFGCFNAQSSMPGAFGQG